MKFECPHCRQHLAVETMYGGQAVTCPACGNSLSIPAQSAGSMAHGAERTEISPAPPPAEPPADKPTPESFLINFAEVKQTLQSNIDRGALTITELMSAQHLDGGVSLEDGTHDTTASEILTDEKGRKYELGKVVAEGGMGAIIDARDANIRRHVAMKVMLKPKECGKDSVLRFIEEAQVTGQLEHPGIVPVHELGVDASGNVFYTMKLIKGRTLKDILTGLKKGDARTVQDYPLLTLLNIFQRVCDAVAFAHSRKVIHRDLKPENVMVGEYGEVQVMDWGLAKILTKKTARRMPHGTERQEEGAASALPAAIESVRKDAGADVFKTLDGAIMGTPGYMAPEQAMGDMELLDERTDIYSLGAILYAILTLRAPIRFTGLAEFIEKVTSGRITPPAELGAGTQTSETGEHTSDRTSQ